MSTPHPIITTTLQTTLHIQHEDLDAIKKALGSWLKIKGSPYHAWIHNHENDDDPSYVQQSYPLVQLRCTKNTLRLWGMQEGADVLQQLMLTEMLQGFQYKGAKFRIQPGQTIAEKHSLGFTKGKRMQQYELNHFIALSPLNFKNWQQLTGAGKRVERLQELIVNNITMFCKAAGFALDKKKLKLKIDWIWNTKWVRIKDYQVLAFTLTYQCNLLMPDGIALGRQTRLGYGWQTLRNGK